MQAEATPAELFGPLLSRVQESGILQDGKTFVDAVPTRPVADILAAFDSLEEDKDALRHFVEANFILPPESEDVRPRQPTASLRQHIRGLWRELAREPQRGQQGSSALPVGHRHVVPGGRFREIYYWDSFFTLLGLVRDGERELANGIVDALTDLIETHGHIPNGSRTYYLGRSQPPLYYLMVALLGGRNPRVFARRLHAMKQEHRWWMMGSRSIRPKGSCNHVVMLADGSLLNRYWDPRTTPRDESWREDVETAAASKRPPEQVYRDLRAGAESGWDFSSRWLVGDALCTIRTTSIVPVDLNAFLYGLECAIAAEGGADSTHYFRLAADRRRAMQTHMWSEAGYFCDLDLETGQARKQPTAAALAPLLTGVASEEQAAATAAFVKSSMLAQGGLRTSLIDSGQQWDSPNGWAPLQWIAATGLRRYGHDELAGEIAQRWIRTVDDVYRQTGLLFEKYDVEQGWKGGGGEYANQIGFGWTNGVTADFLDATASEPVDQAN